MTALLVALAGTGCGERTEERPFSGRHLDRGVASLAPGMSIDAVEAELGRPRLQRNFDEETALYYGWWQLVFTEHGLETRTKYFRHDSSTLRGRTLERRVRALRRGMSIRAVRRLLGKPESIVIFSNAPGKEVNLEFGSWSLAFTGGKLEARSRF